MKTKNIFSLLITSLLIFAMTGCNSGGASSAISSTSNQDSSSISSETTSESDSSSSSTSEDDSSSEDSSSSSEEQEDVCNHIFIDYAAHEASCLEAGNLAYAKCVICHKYFAMDHVTEMEEDSWILPKLAHQMTHHDPVPCVSYEYWNCSLCHKNYSDEEGNYELEDIHYSDIHSIWPKNVRTYLSAVTESGVVAALANRDSFNDQMVKTLRWNSSKAPYEVEVSKDLDFEHSTKYNANSTSLALPANFIPGERYYYRVKDANNNYVVQLMGFDVDDTFTVRTLNVPGVSNVRDLGGWSAEGDNPVLYGKLIRGARLNNIGTEGTRVFLDDLGIKTEIDLRGGNDGIQIINDERLTYLKYGMNQYTMVVPGYNSPEIQGKPAGTTYGYDSSTAASLKNIFETLADPTCYPVYFHCNAGADRTGTVAYFVGGVLGVSYEDLTKDFELTTFSAQGPRYRSGVSDGNFITTGEYAGIYEYDSANYVAWGKLHELISTRYQCKNHKLYSAIEYYLTTVCGISRETITQVRYNLLGKTVEFDEPEFEIDTSFTMENGNWSAASLLHHETGTFMGCECTKFYASYEFKQDHYIYHNLSLINSGNYTNYHFEIYIPSGAPKWNTNDGKDTGARFLFSIKRTSTGSKYINFSEDYTVINPNSAYPCPLDTWNSYDLDITGITDAERFAIYLPYGTADIPTIAYVRNTYVG